MFFHFRDYTISLSQIVSVAWDDEASCASVTMAVGDSYDIDGEDYPLFKKSLGRK